MERGDGQVLLTQRTDDGSWCAPAGAVEVGGSFAKTGIDELFEETGVQVEREDIVPFASLSEEALHTIHYPNGDYALLRDAPPREEVAPRSTSGRRRDRRHCLCASGRPAAAITRATGYGIEPLQEYRRLELSAALKSSNWRAWRTRYLFTYAK